MLKNVQPDPTLRDSNGEAQDLVFPETEENSQEPYTNRFNPKGSTDSCKVDIEKEDDDAVAQ